MVKSTVSQDQMSKGDRAAAREEARQKRLQTQSEKEMRMTVSEMASVFNRNDRFIRQLIHERTLPAIKIGRDWLVLPSDALEVMRSRQRGRGKRPLSGRAPR